METERRTRLSRTKQKADLEGVLRKSWYHLRLAVRHPSRVSTWDAIVLTAASPEQAELYEWQLSRTKRMGRIAASTVTLAVPDPHGHRIGSGAATLHAIHALAAHYQKVEGMKNGVLGCPVPNEGSEDEASSVLVSFIAKRHILLLHAGGDSKRVPWANPMGKVFLPLPYLAADDPDGPVPLLFDHILAIASCARQAFKNEGGVFIMTGDVLPCFDASSLILPEDTSCIITVPITLDVASNHGVIVASKNENVEKSYMVSSVDNLLQKPSLEELVKNNAILDDGRTLLDTGIIAVRGKGWLELVKLAMSSQSLVSELLKSRKEAAWVPARHEWLRLRPLGEELVNSLGKQKMFSYCAYDLLFLHFGTSSEVLDHLSGTGSGLVGRRHLCSIPATNVSDIAASAVVLSSKIEPGVSIGDDSLVYDSSISSGVQIGSLSIVVSINVPKVKGTTESPYRFMLPDRHCLWEVPLLGCTEKVIVYCGLHDNPKDTLSEDGTFCGKPWKKVLYDLGIQESDLWSSSGVQKKCLWNAKIFPVLSYFEMLDLASWLMGLNEKRSKDFLELWRSSPRVSLEELHRSIDFPKMCIGSSNHQAELAAGIAKACMNYGMLGRNLSQLCEEILQKEVSGVEICKDFLDLCPKLLEHNSKLLPKSRAYQVQVDLLRACSNEPTASELEHKVWAAVADETASAVRYGFKEHLLEVPNSISTPSSQINNGYNVNQSFHARSIKVELPVRVDFVGGWSDTPPWSLERAGCVLNMAISLRGSLPVGTIIETTKETGVFVCDDAGNELLIDDLTSIATPFDTNDPFRLVKSALLVTGVIHDNCLISAGLRIKTWANVPRGSGLGTSSILAAAVVKGLVQITDGDASNENVARLVLVLEQIMGTGGGWQDQIGGLYPGIKFTASFPGIPLRLQVTPLLASPQLILELQQRLLVVFTGQVRLAHQVLQKVVTRYLRRDNLLVSSIKRLAELAKIGREALMNCDLDDLGEIMLEAWRLHQELDPYCSNEFVDRLFEFAHPYCCGYKLVGAGGGGFALLLAKDAEHAKELGRLLEEDSNFEVKVYEWNISLA
ncbi:Bifunctional fucokinase/fucose pyrophosphorylase [Morus notabilis]|uniref:Bifunctional fucokinase/fucose pyrophosphorylase n=1 Tax=Morus notabilis TaxID=981085 RepID=W9S2F4_9ROSA|nr:Bifunctional fucokinase/fucose pyrophosphorylase [Morus notabilis]